MLHTTIHTYSRCFWESLTRPIRYGLPASPRRWVVKLWKATAVALRVGITTNCEREAKGEKIMRLCKRWRDRGRKVSHPCKNNPCIHQLCTLSPPHRVRTPQADLSVTRKMSVMACLCLHTHHSLQPNYKLSSSLVHPPYWKSIFICLTRPPVFTFRYHNMQQRKGSPPFDSPSCVWISFGRDSNYQLHLNCNQQSPQSPLTHFTTPFITGSSPFGGVCSGNL